MLVDAFGRRVTNLRISVTSRCNLNCFYCHQEGYSSDKELTPDEISEIAGAFKSLGIRKVKITGGEPLIRKDIVEIVEKLPEFDEVSMTTNGALLPRYAHELSEAGLDRVNVSLDTLDEEKYRIMTRGGRIERVIDGIHEAVNAGLTPVKINMVLISGFNLEEVDRMVEFVRKFNGKVILQLIELVSLNYNGEGHFDVYELARKFEENAKEVRVRSMQRRKQYVFEDYAVELVKPVDNSEFCSACNRIRVTADGKIKPCLMRNDNLIDIRGLRGESLINAIKKAVMLREPYYRG
ncbi:putative molybdenum cofactor biosynthesis protein A [Geoglobus ahangari]|uniref:Probable GTP 3',8-cyclase n=1 Tax=Geoglobus ahangari TaxID=113653 RepID=A0A0F7IG56_9EURY|nr:GTP 3',8-cyclase MoaA [Geoglobus ahangari]AKG92184.1 putative molybdenum cofactor biosynthesis protein A [Geoglobus ahangari]